MKIVKTKVVMTDSIEAVEIDKILLQVNNLNFYHNFRICQNKNNDFWKNFKTIQGIAGVSKVTCKSMINCWYLLIKSIEEIYLQIDLVDKDLLDINLGIKFRKDSSLFAITGEKTFKRLSRKLKI